MDGFEEEELEAPKSSEAAPEGTEDEDEPFEEEDELDGFKVEGADDEDDAV
ncbi:MAG: hypothetical protein JWM39_745 [Parcubacteria group bacterium]|nr:hypothetical protein [Parcubacteria group bacterium]